MVLSYTVQRLPTVVLEVEYTPAVEFVCVRHGVTHFLCRQLRSMTREDVCVMNAPYTKFRMSLVFHVICNSILYLCHSTRLDSGFLFAIQPHVEVHVCSSIIYSLPSRTMIRCFRLAIHPSRIFLYFLYVLYFRYSTSPGSNVLCFRVLCTFESTNWTSISHENFVCLLNLETYISKYIVLFLRSVLFVINKIIALHAAHYSHSHT